MMHYIKKKLSEAAKSNHGMAFEWVSSHCGIKGNEIADELAITAHHLRKPALFVYLNCDVQMFKKNEP